MIDLYTSPTPNGYKASVTLEELELDYNVHVIDIQAGDQKKPEFLAINPNGRIPAIIDRDLNDLRVFESAAIMIHLAEKLESFCQQKRKLGRSNVVVDVSDGRHCPMMGQANVFFRYFPEKIQPAIDRYQNEVRRLFEVLNTHLDGREWLAKDFSVADIANWCWIRTASWSGVESRDLEHLQRWQNAMEARPKCVAGTKIPFDITELLKAEGKDAEQFAKEAEKLVQK